MLCGAPLRAMGREEQKEALWERRTIEQDDDGVHKDRTGGCAGTRIASRDFADGEGVRLGKEAEGAGRYGELDGLARGCRIPRLLFFLLFYFFTFLDQFIEIVGVAFTC